MCGEGEWGVREDGRGGKGRAENTEERIAGEETGERRKGETRAWEDRGAEGRPGERRAEQRAGKRGYGMVDEGWEEERLDRNLY